MNRMLWGEAFDDFYGRYHITVSRNNNSYITTFNKQIY